MTRCPVDGLYHHDGEERRINFTLCRCGNEVLVHGGPLGLGVLLVGDCEGGKEAPSA